MREIRSEYSAFRMTREFGFDDTKPIRNRYIGTYLHKLSSSLDARDLYCYFLRVRRGATGAPDRRYVTLVTRSVAIYGTVSIAGKHERPPERAQRGPRNFIRLTNPKHLHGIAIANTPSPSNTRYYSNLPVRTRSTLAIFARARCINRFICSALTVLALHRRTRGAGMRTHFER